MTTNLFLLIHLGVFILVIALALLLMKLRGAGARVNWCIFTLVSIIPVYNIFLLVIFLYELILSLGHRVRRRRRIR